MAWNSLLFFFLLLLAGIDSGAKGNGVERAIFLTGAGIIAGLARRTEA